MKFVIPVLTVVYAAIAAIFGIGFVVIFDGRSMKGWSVSAASRHNGVTGRKSGDQAKKLRLRAGRRRVLWIDHWPLACREPSHACAPHADHLEHHGRERPHPADRESEERIVGKRLSHAPRDVPVSLPVLEERIVGNQD